MGFEPIHFLPNSGCGCKRGDARNISSEECASTTPPGLFVVGYWTSCFLQIYVVACARTTHLPGDPMQVAACVCLNIP